MEHADAGDGHDHGRRARTTGTDDGHRRRVIDAGAGACTSEHVLGETRRTSIRGMNYRANFNMTRESQIEEVEQTRRADDKSLILSWRATDSIR